MSRQRRSLVLVLVGALIAILAVPALAAAATFEVTGLGDAPTLVGCQTPEGECTLRGAILAANDEPGKDTITFKEDVFEGAAPEATITIGSPLPTIEEAVSIKALELGGQCLTGWNPIEGPCAEITGLGGSEPASLTVDASGVTIEGLAIEGGITGIAVEEGADGFVARDDWFGVGLNRSEGTENARAGILLEPGADGATIGGEVATARNVFTHGDTGVEALGASTATILGNWFGVLPDGTYSGSDSLQAGVRILDWTGASPAKAEHDQVGGELLGPAASTPACDGACNVFATNGGADVDLGGYEFFTTEIAAATGPTSIEGNYLGLRPDGSAPIDSSEIGINAVPQSGGERGPVGLRIGGSETTRNYIDGADIGISASAAEALSVLDNRLGYLADGQPTDAAPSAAMQIRSHGLPAGALISGNSVNASRSTGIESFGVGSEITDNEIVGGSPGILTEEDDGGVGNLISGNRLVEQERFGIRIANDSNVLTGNTVVAANEVGIVLFAPAEHNRIGGDGAGEANTIEETGVPNGEGEGAIVISGFESSLNEVAANLGTANEGPFIVLSREEVGENHPNEDIQPPVIGAALQSSASGSGARAGATIRVFSKATDEEGELGALIGTGQADASGNWMVTFTAKQPVGTIVTATQTSTVGGTSMLAATKTAVADPVKPEEPKGTPTPPPTIGPLPTEFVQRPVVKITKGPKRSSTATTATFKFKASISGAKFECKLDNATWAACRSPKTYKKLKPGKHTFQVRAKAKGALGAAAKFKFTVKS